MASWKIGNGIVSGQKLKGQGGEPGEGRRIHRRPVPLLGGIALFLAIFIPALAFLTLDGEYRGLLIGAALATLLGLVDDTRGLPWWAHRSSGKPLTPRAA